MCVCSLCMRVRACKQIKLTHVRVVGYATSDYTHSVYEVLSVPYLVLIKFHHNAKYCCRRDAHSIHSTGCPADYPSPTPSASWQFFSQLFYLFSLMNFVWTYFFASTMVTRYNHFMMVNCFLLLFSSFSSYLINQHLSLFLFYAWVFVKSLIYKTRYVMFILYIMCSSCHKILW